jgi:glycerol-3-phosphate acyltransferase PlsX
MLIALDAMGGDHAPGPIVAGAVQAVHANPDLRVLLVGDRGQVEAALAHAGGQAGGSHDRLEFFHCTQVVSMDDTPVDALRKKPDNSIKRCWELLAQRKVDGIVSAGNTGAMVAGGFMLKRFLKNVKRPGIAAVMPTLRGPCVMLDVGANVFPKPEHLYQYGVMGSIFARHILNKPKPTIGLMNVGEEEGKGHDLTRDTHELFVASPLRDQFIGNIEGRDICRGAVDVVVSDGFTGNVVLKTCEGVFDFTMKMVAQELMQSLDAERDKGKQALERLADRYDHAAQGGAPLLGIDGACIICHGSSNERAIKSALGIAAQYAKSRLNDQIVQELESTPASTSG